MMSLAVGCLANSAIDIGDIAIGAATLNIAADSVLRIALPYYCNEF